jgi:hypothetical protein
MSDSNNGNNSNTSYPYPDSNGGDLNELMMKFLVYVFVVFMIFCLVLFTINAFIVGPKKNCTDREVSENFETDTSSPSVNTMYLKNNDFPNSNSNNNNALNPESIIKTVIKSQQGQLMDVVLHKERVPIDYWIFKKMADDGSIDDKVIVYMTDLQDSTFSNQNARRLIHEILTHKNLTHKNLTQDHCGTPNDENNGSLSLYTIPELCSDRRVLINWIFNHSWFTSARSKRYGMYNLYKKYFPIPFDADDYDTPLLEDSKPYSTNNPVEVSKSISNIDIDNNNDNDNDIHATNYLDVQETSKVMCSDQLFIEQSPEFSLYCNGKFLQWNGERSNSSEPIVARYYMVIVTDPEPIFSYTSDGLVTLSTDSLSSDLTKRFEYIDSTTKREPINHNQRVERLSDMIISNPHISWRRVKNRVDQKLSKLGELMVQEHRQESMIDGIQKLLNSSYIDMYQTFGIDIVIRDGEPYIFRIESSPVFKEQYSSIAHDMLESLVDRTKLMLRL